MSRFAHDLLDRARAFGTATLHEASSRRGALPAAIKPIAPSFRLCGPAFPVHSPAFDNLWIHRAVYAASPGDVLVVATENAPEAGYWGEILNIAAVMRGLGGLVIDGGVRDIHALSAAHFPVFSRGICIRGTKKDRGAAGWLDGPIRIGEVVIRPGDLIAGDADGVVAIPSEMVDDVLAAAAEREKDEMEKIARIRDGERTIDIYGFGAG